MQKINIKLAVSSLILASTFTGCVNSSNLSSNLNSNEHFIDISKEDKQFTSIQNGIFSLSGLLSIPKLGFTYFNTDDRKPLYLVGYSKDTSFYITQTIENANTQPQELESIRDDLMKLRKIALEIIQDKIKNYSKTKDFISGSNKVLDNQFNDLYANLSSKIKKEGVFILSWNSNGKNIDNSKIDFFGKATSDANQKLQDSGFMIINGLKISTLYAGKDMINYWSDINPEIEKANTYPKVVTSTIQAKDIYYFSQISYAQEIQNMIDIKLNSIVDDSTFNKDIFLKSISLYEQKYFNKIKNINSVGITSKMKKDVYPLFYDKPSIERVKQFVNGAKDWKDDNSSDWQTIYSVDTDIFKLTKWFKKQTDSNAIAKIEK